MQQTPIEYTGPGWYVLRDDFTIVRGRGKFREAAEIEAEMMRSYPHDSHDYKAIYIE